MIIFLTLSTYYIVCAHALLLKGSVVNEKACVWCPETSLPSFCHPAADEVKFCGKGLGPKEKPLVEYAQCPEALGETTFGVIAFILLLCMCCCFICCIKMCVRIGIECGDECNQRGKVTNFIRDETPPAEKWSDTKKNLVFSGILTLFILLVAIAESLKLFLNVGMIAQSVEFGRESYVAAKTHLELITETFNRVLGPIFSSVWAALASLTQFFSISVSFPDGWECEGYWSAGSFTIIFFLSICLGILIESNVFFFLAIQMRSWGQGSKIKKMLYRLLSGVLTTISTYSLQILVSGYSTAFSFIFTWRYATGESQSCGALDSTLYYLCRIIGYVLSFLLFAFLADVFGSSSETADVIEGELADFWTFWPRVIRHIPKRLRELLMLTFGCWSNKQVKSYDLVELADKYDDDPEDTDNQHAAVGKIIGKTRSIFWQLFPGGTILTKFGEASNTYIFFMFSKDVDFDRKESKKMQFAKYLANVLPMVFTVIVALFPSVGVVTLTTIMLIPKILIDAFDQTKEIVDACAPHAGEAVAVGVQMAGHAFAKGGKALNAAKPHVEEGVARGKELGKTGIAKGKEYGSNSVHWTTMGIYSDGEANDY